MSLNARIQLVKLFVLIRLSSLFITDTFGVICSDSGCYPWHCLLKSESEIMEDQLHNRKLMKYIEDETFRVLELRKLYHLLFPTIV